MQNATETLHFAYYILLKITVFSFIDILPTSYPYSQNVKFQLHFAFFHKVQLEIDRILKETTLKLNTKEE